MGKTTKKRKPVKHDGIKTVRTKAGKLGWEDHESGRYIGGDKVQGYERRGDMLIAMATHRRHLTEYLNGELLRLGAKPTVTKLYTELRDALGL